MTQVFEDYFSELQTDMVSLCLEYVESKADEIFIYCSYEPDAYYFNVFYKIQGAFVLKHQLNEIYKGGNHESYDVSDERQIALQRMGVEDLKEIHKVCKKFEREMPTEMKIHYNVEMNKLDAEYNYDLKYSVDETLLPKDIFKSWFEEMSENLT